MGQHGPNLPVTSRWKEQVQVALDERGWTRARLAEEVGCSGAAITTILRPETNRSRLVAPICRVLDIPYPIAEIRDELDARWYEAGEHLTDQERRLILGFIDALMARRK